MRTKTNNTRQEYLDCALRQMKEFKKEKGVSASKNWDDYVQFIISKKTHVTSSTWRYYKAANVYVLEQNNAEDAATALKLTDNEGVKAKSDSTSALKKKYISENQENTIRKTLLDKVKSGDRWSRLILSYFETILAVGVRPIEISQSTYHDEHDNYDGDGPVLVVKNAKATNGRSFGEFRYIGLSDLSEKQINYIKLSTLWTQKGITPDNEPVELKELYEKIRFRYRYLVKKLFPKLKYNISLYSCRHQCIADLKAAGYSLVEIAVIVGHGNDVTATEHYGKKRFGIKRNGLPSPNETDKNKVRRFYDKKIIKKESKLNSTQIDMNQSI